MRRMSVQSFIMFEVFTIGSIISRMTKEPKDLAENNPKPHNKMQFLL